MHIKFLDKWQSGFVWIAWFQFKLNSSHSVICKSWLVNYYSYYRAMNMCRMNRHKSVVLSALRTTKVLVWRMLATLTRNQQNSSHHWCRYVVLILWQDTALLFIGQYWYCLQCFFQEEEMHFPTICTDLNWITRWHHYFCWNGTKFTIPGQKVCENDFDHLEAACK